MSDDDFEWDEVKARANVRKHKVSFRDARRIFDDVFILIERDFSEDYGEDRYVATGMVEGLLLTVVYVESGLRIRLISARKANGYEQRKYYRS
jgi:uncharacterized DUF497 family protein